MILCDRSFCVTAITPNPGQSFLGWLASIYCTLAEACMKTTYHLKMHTLYPHGIGSDLQVGGAQSYKIRVQRQHMTTVPARKG
jgi:hypothetical protein